PSADMVRPHGGKRSKAPKGTTPDDGGKADALRVMAPLLELRKVAISYGGIRAVRGCDLPVARGELVCLIGGNGAGKTTTLKGVCGLLPLREGAIVYDGADVT